MSAPVKKVGEKIVKTALKEARAVTAAEAPFVEPAKTSTTETMMPWKGWVGRWFSKTFGEERYQAARQILFYRADDIHDMNQIPNPSTKVPINKEGTEFHQFRYPSPGSQPAVRIPDRALDADPYNVAYYPHDTINRESREAEQTMMKIAMMDDPESEEAKALAESVLQPASSPGNKGRFATGPTDFDPTGLRASMSANHEALNESLANDMPDHLPYPTWYSRQEEFAAWYEEHDLPMPVGEPYDGITVPIEARVAKW